MAHLHGWRYCPRCAHALEHDAGCVRCPVCTLVVYAGSAPAVSALVLSADNRLLLARRAHEPDAGLWDTPGGFLEEGELPETGLRRELLEETGLEIEPTAFVGTAMDTYGTGLEANAVLNLVYEAGVERGVATAADDVSELCWFPLDALPEVGEWAFRWAFPFVRDWARRQHR